MSTHLLREIDMAAKITWIETTEERYYEMLGVLPPASQGSMIGAHGFQVGEPTDHNERGEPTFASFKEEVRVMGSKFYESAESLTFREFKAEFSDAKYYYA